MFKVLKRHLLYKTERYSKYVWTIYNNDYSIKMHFDGTYNQVKKQFNNPELVSGMDVYANTNGTMGYRNLNDDIKQAFKENYGT